ncbi:beta-1,3-galactosyltransferase 1-like [Gigantopelta aegis]|uniref:beta-1,3-galactosyltransferase 1-like n=1 Tax=Gigantopelta aegis TaxID=1735272 RepID=UPI001B88B004|nr:beta-1,3-galactosyltransferase 1-like [Gigantopelta aegis]
MVSAGIVMQFRSVFVTAGRHRTTQTDLHIEGPVVNPHLFRYLLNPKTFCSKKDIFIIAYVHSTPDHFEKRDAIRQTWGKMKYYLNKRAEVVFIMGQVANTGVMTSVRNESGIHGDIVQEDFVDSYRNLTYKAIAGLKWVSTFCRQAVYVLKTDGDIFVNVYALVKYMQSTAELRYARTKLIQCIVWQNMKVIRNNSSKWYVSKEEFSPNVYPPYCSGSAYLMSSGVTGRLYRTSLTTQFFWVDDYYITGLLVHKLNITHRPYNRAYVFDNSRVLEELNNTKHHSYVFFHVNVPMMFKLWNVVISRESKDVRAKHYKRLDRY